MAVMRDGSTVADPRFGRLKQDDPRNRLHLVRRTLDPTTKPRSYTWSIPLQLDQGSLGSCVGNAFAHELAARPGTVAGVDQTLAVSLYQEAQTIDPWPETYHPGGEEGTSVLAGVKTVVARGGYTGYEWAYNVHDLSLAVGFRGPAVIGVDWYAGMMDRDSSGFIHPVGQHLGGHAILVAKVSVRNRYFGCWQSWGSGQRDGGWWLISFPDMEMLLDQGGEACVPVGRRAKLTR